MSLTNFTYTIVIRGRMSRGINHPLPSIDLLPRQYGRSQFQNPEVFPSHKTVFTVRTSCLWLGKFLLFLALCSPVLSSWVNRLGVNCSDFGWQYYPNSSHFKSWDTVKIETFIYTLIFSFILLFLFMFIARVQRFALDQFLNKQITGFARSGKGCIEWWNCLCKYSECIQGIGADLYEILGGPRPLGPLSNIWQSECRVIKHSGVAKKLR